MDAIAGLRDGFLRGKICRLRAALLRPTILSRTPVMRDGLPLNGSSRLGFKCAAHRILSNTLDKICAYGNFVRLHSTKS